MKSTLHYVMDEISDGYGNKRLARVGRMSTNIKRLKAVADAGTEVAHVMKVGQVQPVYHKMFNYV